MTPGSRSRRIAREAAGGVVAALALALGFGCNGLPIGRIAPAPNRPQTTLGKVGRAALLPATVALDVPSEMSPIDPSSSSSGMVTPASAIGSEPRADLISTEAPDPAPRPTPLLDAALVRAKIRGEVVDPAEPTAIPDLPQPAPSLPTVGAVAPSSPSVGPEAVVGSPTPAPDVRPIPPEAAPTPVAPEELWRDGVRKLVGLARLKQEQAGIGNGGAEPWGLRARVLAWLAEPDIDPDLGQRDSDTVRSVLRALQVTTAGDGRGDTHTRGDDVRTAVQTLEAKAPLELVDLRLCSKVDAFGDFTLFDSPGRRAGERVIIYCEVDGVHHEPTSRGFQTRLAGRLEIIPDDGGPSIAAPFGPVEETLPRRRRDYCINYLKELPRDLVPGQYTVRITLTDVFAERSTTRVVPLTIVRDKEPVASSPHEPTPTP